MEVRSKIRKEVRRKSGNLKGKHLIAHFRKDVGDEVMVKIGSDEACRKIVGRFVQLTS